MLNKFCWILFVFFAVGVGAYPVAYLLFDMTGGGLIATKQSEVVNNAVWLIAFYVHISFGGLSLLTGWSQFSKRIRNRNLSLHRSLGKIYLISVMLSGLTGLYISFFATGGWIASVGFGGLAIAWLFTSSAAYRSIKMKDIDAHEAWMIRSYAVTFAAVTLRIWLPMSAVAGFAFIDAYRVISYLCWIPNLMIAELIISTMRRKAVVRA